MPSTDHAIAFINDLAGTQLATAVEVDGSVQRDLLTGQPVGTLLGTAVEDTITGARINAYLDPQGRLFYGSFTAAAPR